MTNMLSRLRLNARAWVAPGFTLLLMLVVAAGGFLAMRHQHATVGQLVSVRTPNLLAIMEFEAQVKQIQSGSYKLLAWSTASYSADQTDRLAKSIGAELQKAAQAAQDLKQQPGMSSKEMQIVDQLTESTAVFSKIIAAVVDMADADQSFATTMMITSEKPFAKLLGSVNELRELQSAAMDAAANDTTAVFKNSMAMGATLLAVCILLSGWAIRNNVRMMAVIAEQNANLELRVAERTLQLRQKTVDIQAMLQNMPQGVLTVLPGGVIHSEYSAYLETIFETKDIVGKNVMDLVFSNTDLGADTAAQVEAAVGACIGEDLMNMEFNAHLLVTAFDKTFDNGQAKSLELSWSPICGEDDAVVEKLMLCVRDVTELKKLAAASGQQKRELEIIGEILSVSQEKFHGFIDGANQFLVENEKLIQATQAKENGVINQLFRNMHTIKGNARTFGLLHLTNLVHEVEQHYDALRNDADCPWDQEKLLAELATAARVVEEYAHINEVKLGRKGPGRRSGVEKYLMVQKQDIQDALDVLDDSMRGDDLGSMRSASKRVQNMLQTLGTVRIDDILDGIVDSLPSLARELAKESPDIVMNDHGIVVRTQIADLLKNVFMHLYRNSLDHGIEMPADRVAKGKPARGRIQLELALVADRLWLHLQDDGRGLAVSALRRKAIEKGLLSEQDQPSPEDIAQLIFAPGFSTAAVVTEVSGRGVGMDAVKDFVQREGGTIELRFLDQNAQAEFRPFETAISLPGKFALQVKT
jgi:two-component system chemotaxis sensor kinase CheA